MNNLEYLNGLGIDPKAVMIGQLKFLRDFYLSDASFEHDHWTDDCGDYAHAALSLATDLQGGYLNATELGVADVIMELAQPDSGTGLSTLFANHACDGIGEDIDTAVATICKDKGWSHSGEEN